MWAAGEGRRDGKFHDFFALINFSHVRRQSFADMRTVWGGEWTCCCKHVLQLFNQHALNLRETTPARWRPSTNVAKVRALTLCFWRIKALCCLLQRGDNLKAFKLSMQSDSPRRIPLQQSISFLVEK